MTEREKVSAAKELVLTLRRAVVTLFGGRRFYLSLSLTALQGRLHYLVGANASGKTVTLKSLAYLFSMALDPIKSVQHVDSSSGASFVGFDPLTAKSAFVEQDTANNFDASPISDNIRDYLGRAGISTATAEEVEDLLLNELGLKSDDLFKLPHQFSTGQQQVLAIALRMAIRPTFVFLDEPFSRLSRRWVDRLLAFCDNHGADSFLLAASHPSDLRLQEGAYFSASTVLRSDERITVESEGNKTVPSLPEASFRRYRFVQDHLAQDALEDACKRYDNLHDLPQDHVVFLSSSGDPIPLLDRRLTIEKTGVELTHVALSIASGLNLLIGDNGSGKTLVGKALTNQLWYKGLLVEVAEKTLSKGPLCYTYDFKLYSRRTRAILDKSKTFFIPSEPRLLSEPTLEREHAMCGTTGRRLLDRVLDLYRIDLSDKPSSQSYGIQKIIQLCLVPDDAVMVLLDEPFGSLSDEMQDLVARHIMERAEKGSWRYVIVTSNRPIETLGILDRAAYPTTGV